MMVYVISKGGKPLMPTSRHGMVKHLLRRNEAKVVTTEPFTIQLLRESAEHTQSVTLGIDSGYLHMGFSAVADGKELISGNVKLLEGMSKRIAERAMYRRNRRGRLRYRKNRGKLQTKPKGWLAPSIQHKLDSQVRFVTGKLAKILPITKVIVKVASFDIQRIKDPGIEGVEYQRGLQYGHKNVKEYVLHRDGHKCQNPDCKNKKLSQPKGDSEISKVPLVVHHISYRKDGGTLRPDNLVALCTHCHSAPNHLGFLKDWKPKSGGFKAETFMTMVRWKIIDKFKEAFGDGSVAHTYGYITKADREALGLEKSHANDAFSIAGGGAQTTRSQPLEYVQVRRNNRSIEKFYDAKYIDARTGEAAKAAVLNNGRAHRNKNLNGENLRQSRGRKLSKGRRSIRKKRHPYQPYDQVKYGGKVYTVKGAHNGGKRVILKETGKSISVNELTPYRYGKGFACVSQQYYERGRRVPPPPIETGYPAPND